MVYPQINDLSHGFTERKFFPALSLGSGAWKIKDEE